VLAVLAFACSPALAHAEEATGIQYESEVPTVPSEQSPGGGHPGGSQGGNGGPHAGISNHPGENGTGGGKTPGAGGESHTGQGNQAPEGNGTQTPHGEKSPKGVVENQTIANPAPGNSTAAENDSSSSPLVPILIAIVVLAAISIGAFYYRQRRQGAGSSVSPKAS
jgi:cobalamin biosynthesis Mg chelatase CobN